LHTRYTHEVLSGAYQIHEEINPIIDENGQKQEPYYILISDIIEKIGRREHLISKIAEITENIYFDAYKENITTIEKKEDALKSILGF